jgi:hypothetical protein
MNRDTVLMCAQMAAAQQLAGLGQVNPAILDLIDDLTIPMEKVSVVIESAVVEESSAAAEEAPAAE